MSSTRPLLLGHRGARAVKSIPENTFASFDRALADGCDGFEFDVRLTSDGVPVICHDPRFNDAKIARSSREQCSGLPGLEEVLARYCDRAFLDIELKVEGLEEVTAKLLQRFPPKHGFVVSSFLPEVVQAVHSRDANIPLGFIWDKRKLERWSQLPIEYVIPHRKLVSPELIRQCKGAAKKMLVWTVNQPEEMRRLRDWGVDGIVSDKTALLSQTLG